MAVMLVVNNSKVRQPLRPQPLDNSHLILRLSKPAAMIIQRHHAPHFSRRFRNGLDALRFRLDPRPLPFSAARWSAPASHPKLWMKLMACEHFENEFGFLVHGGGEPPGRQ